MRRRLRTALEWIGEGSIAEKMLADANDYIVNLRRRGDTDAAGLVVCVDCAHASAVADHMDGGILGQRPIVACSRLFNENDPEPANAIRRFASSHDPWLVAVNMVSEGIDIRRLRVVVYLTNRLTLLAFRQIIGRVVRIDPTNVDDHGRVYIPGDPRLVEMARQVAAETELLPAPIVIETDPPVIYGRGKRAVAARGEFEALRSVGEQGRVIDSEGREASAELVAARACSLRSRASRAPIQNRSRWQLWSRINSAPRFWRCAIGYDRRCQSTELESHGHPDRGADDSGGRRGTRFSPAGRRRSMVERSVPSIGRIVALVDDDLISCGGDFGQPG